MNETEIINLIKTKDNWNTKELITIIKSLFKKQVKISFYHIGGYECLRDGTQVQHCKSLQDVKNLLNDHDIEYDETIQDPIELVKSIEDEWIEMHDDGGGSGWIEF